jgi:hypothetical protein
VNHRVGLQYDVPEQLVFPMEILKQNNKWNIYAAQEEL